MSDAEPVKVPESAPPGSATRPPGHVRRLYEEEWKAWRTHYRRYFKYAARALGLGFVAGFLYFMIWPAREMKALAFVVKSLEDIPLEAAPLVLSLTLFFHNARASVIAMAAGAVPFLFLPILDPLINGGALGLICSVAKHQGLNVPHLVMTQILPHGVFELAAALYATSVGLYLSMSLGKAAVARWRRWKGRRAEGNRPVSVSPDFPQNIPERVSGEPGSLVRDAVRSFVLVVLPLLLVAAFIEGFITPNLR
ncbi:MAG: stage II sporulation protein M [Candidatus Aminicenantes bacterium]|nr:MAG: stage II sporulation protein M [Candidatus Aminicenantes bacterium]